MASVVVTATRFTPGRPGARVSDMPGVVSPKASGTGAIATPAVPSVGGVVASAAVISNTEAIRATSTVRRVRMPSSQARIRPPSRKFRPPSPTAAVASTVFRISVRPYSVPGSTRTPVWLHAVKTPVNPTMPTETSATAEKRGTEDAHRRQAARHGHQRRPGKDRQQQRDTAGPDPGRDYMSALDDHRDRARQGRSVASADQQADAHQPDGDGERTPTSRTSEPEEEDGTADQGDQTAGKLQEAVAGGQQVVDNRTGLESVGGGEDQRRAAGHQQADAKRPGSRHGQP